MSEYVEKSMKLQEAISERLAEFAFANREQAERISRQMAELAVRGKSFADDTLPVFLNVSRDNTATVAQVAMAMKIQIEELGDTVNDLRRDLADWADFFMSGSER